jgi:hypothetical protein
MSRYTHASILRVTAPTARGLTCRGGREKPYLSPFAPIRIKIKPSHPGCVSRGGMDNLARARKKKGFNRTSRLPPIHSGRPQADTSSVRSHLRAARKWIIGALLAGLAASITAVMVNLVQKELSSLGPAYYGSDTGGGQEINTASGPIIAVSVGEGFNGGCFGNMPGWVFPAKSVSVLSAPPGSGIRHQGRTWDQDPYAFGAAAADSVMLRIIASGPSARAIVLDGIKVRVLHRRPPLHGTLVNLKVSPPSCGPGVVQTGTVNLDTSPPTITPEQSAPSSPSNLNGGRTEPLVFPYTVSESDPEIIGLTVTTQHCDCTWVAELDWTAGSRVGHTTIEDNGQPFQTTADKKLPTLTWTQYPNGSWGRNWIDLLTAATNTKPMPSRPVRRSRSS